MISALLSCDVEYCDASVQCEVKHSSEVVRTDPSIPASNDALEVVVDWPYGWQGWDPESIVAQRTGIVHRCPRHALSMLDIVAFL